MNMQSNAVPDPRVDSRAVAPAAVSATRPFYWSVRRELWEYRSIYIAPLAVAGVVLFGFLIATIGRAMATGDPAQKVAVLSEQNGFAAGLIMATAFIVGIFYSLDALHSERRDRSILFWKSLPVSDLTTVLSKASIPLVILPLLTFSIVVVTQVIMGVMSTLALWASGLAVGTLWTHWFQTSLMLLYHLVTLHVLWHAPIYAWLLLVSGWARRLTFLWAVLPPVAIGVLEKVAFNTSHFAAFMGYRMRGPEEFDLHPHGNAAMHSLMTMDLGHFLSTPGLWIGLVVAAAFLAAAARQRRYRGPT
ncbi:MAG: ABC transporter permease [Terriglobales bacterium]